MKIFIPLKEAENVLFLTLILLRLLWLIGKLSVPNGFFLFCFVLIYRVFKTSTQDASDKGKAFFLFLRTYN